MKDRVKNELSGKQADLFGAKLHLLTMAETVDLIISAIKNQFFCTHSVLNVAKVVKMQKDESLKRAVNACDVVNVDGMGLVWGGRFLNLPIPERVTGIDLMQNLLKRAQEEKMRVFFLGAKEDILLTMISKVRQTFPDLEIAGYHHGYFHADDESALIEKIRLNKPHILCVAMSSPKKELFIENYAAALKETFIMGVGGSFDVIAGYVRRAPTWMQSIGLEWFYRLCQEPKRMWKRYAITNSIFLWMLIKAKCGI